MTWALIGLLAGPVGAQAVTEFEQWQLGSDCRPMNLVVHVQRSGAPDLDITETQIRNAIESRLRAARLYEDDVGTLEKLNVNIHVAGPGIGITFKYKAMVIRRLGDGESDKFPFMVGLWENSGTGTHRGDSGGVLQSVAEHTDEFLNAFLRVNESACEVRWQARPNPFRDEDERQALEDEARRRGLIE